MCTSTYVCVLSVSNKYSPHGFGDEVVDAIAGRGSKGPFGCADEGRPVCEVVASSVGIAWVFLGGFLVWI